MKQSLTPHPQRRSPRAKRPINTHPVQNRIRSFMEHTTRYAFMGEVRLARDCDVSCAAISRLMAGRSCPSFPLIVRIGQAFEKQFKKSIDLREIVSLDGHYPTATVCEIVGCRGCTAEADWNADDTLQSNPSRSDSSRSNDCTADTSCHSSITSPRQEAS